MKTNTPTHNPIPWETHTVRTRGTGNRSIFEHCLVSGHRIIGKLLVTNKNARADAAFIVRACNEYETLKNEIDDLSVSLDRARNLKDELLEMVKEMYSAIDNGHSLKFTHVEYKEAISKAEGRI